MKTLRPVAGLRPIRPGDEARFTALSDFLGLEVKTWSQVVFFLSLGSLLLDTQGSGISFPPWVSVFPSVKQGGWHLPRLTLPQQDFWQFDVYKLVIGQTIVSLGTGPIKVKMPGLDFHMPLAFQSPTFKAFFFFF